MRGTILAASVALGMMVVSSAQAQGTTKPQRKDAVRSDAPKGVTVDASKIPTKQKKRRVEKMLVEQRGALARAAEILADTRARKNIAQLNCVNEKLTQIKGLLKISEIASLKMYEGIAENRQDMVNFEYTKVAVANGKSSLLRAEAEQCVGKQVVFTGDTEVTLEIDSDIQQRDPTEPSSPPAGPQQPPVASVSR